MQQLRAELARREAESRQHATNRQQLSQVDSIRQSDLEYIAQLKSQGVLKRARLGETAAATSSTERTAPMTTSSSSTDQQRSVVITWKDSMPSRALIVDLFTTYGDVTNQIWQPEFHRAIFVFKYLSDAQEALQYNDEYQAAAQIEHAADPNGPSFIVSPLSLDDMEQTSAVRTSMLGPPIQRATWFGDAASYEAETMRRLDAMAQWARASS